jgi:uncharacterized protein (DUF2336 family)
MRSSSISKTHSFQPTMQRAAQPPRVCPADRSTACVGPALLMNTLCTRAGLAEMAAAIDYAATPDYLILPETESGARLSMLDPACEATQGHESHGARRTRRAWALTMTSCYPPRLNDVSSMKPSPIPLTKSRPRIPSKPQET